MAGSLTQSSTVYAFVALQGRMPRASVASRLYARPSVDGAGVVYGEWSSPVVELVSRAYAANLSAANTLAENYRKVAKDCKAGTLVTIADGLGSTWSNAAVLDARPQIDAAMAGGGAYLVSCSWTILPATVVPT